FGPGKLVGVMLDRNPEMVAALIGILRAGAAYLPLDPALPPARLAWIAADARIDVLLAEPSIAPDRAVTSCPTIMLAECTPAEHGAAAVPVSPLDLAYILYTSGSTGTPKGVEIEHGALMNLLASIQANPGFDASDSLLAVTTISFDIAGLELFLPLISGGTLILASSSTARDIAALRNLVTSRSPTMMQATPATWRALVDAGLPAMPGMTILCGGEALAPDLAAALRQRCARLWNMYGPTETTIWSTMHEVVGAEATVPIGRPIDATNLHILGADGWPVVDGAAGELFIGGAGLARGYRHRPDLTSERFVDRPFAPGLRLYRTGDVVRAGDDGALLYLGRTDGEEKIRGHRVAVEEVERALQQLQTVAQAAVRSWPDATGERMLVAYVVEEPSSVLDSALLRTQLAKTLPGYMIPSRFQAIAALPLTPNKKVDRKALPALTDVTAARADRVLTDREVRLASLWREVLGVATVALDDSFFDLGGTSLMIAALLRRIETEFACKMTMASIFRAHRLGEMARAIDQDHASELLVPIQPGGSRPPLLWLDGGPKFRALGAAIGPEQPFFGVPLDDVLKDIDSQSVSFEQCANRVAQLILEIHPAGPYFIGGWCTSGILAYAVAVNLQASGSSVPLVILADAENPSQRRSLHVLLTKTSYYVRRLVRQVGGDRLRYLQKRLQGVINLFKARPTFDHHGHDALRDAMDIAALSYQPVAYGGPVALLCSHEWVGARDAVNGWLPVMSGPVVAHEFSGDHDSLLKEPEVSELAASIHEAIANLGQVGTTA
ncbi:MAG: amino acid adenylation domain-containing protein, partial [Pseudomonadota bacterium]|nr:amino acid adenylation domain-containing protein [Pseudomonadota bacterium]